MAKSAGGGGRISVVPARYAKGKMALSAPPDGDWASSAQLLAQAVGGRYSNRERAYIVSPKQAQRVRDLARRGYTANPVSGEIYKPKGR